MVAHRREMLRYLPAVLLLVLPAVLLVNSLLTYQELNQTRNLYLRNRAATLAVRLENLQPGQLGPGLLDLLVAEEPALEDLEIYDSPAAGRGNRLVESLWKGEALFHVATIRVDGRTVFRAYLPFHLDGKLRIVRVDLAPAAADFLVAHTRRNVVLGVLASLVMILFSAYFLWSEHRAAGFERRQLELEHLARLGKLSAVLAHEIRNPLGTIKGFVQLALERAGGEVGQFLDPVLEEVLRLERLVDELLLYGRPRRPEPRPVRWEDLAARLRAHAAEWIGSRPIRFTVDGAAGEFSTDSELLLQALLNLVRNSVEALAGEPGGEVRVAVRGTPRNWVITVEDDGPGLPGEVRRKLFEPFTTTKAQGAGLGLAITRKLVTTLGGRVEIGPRRPRGTRAALIFPK